MYEILKLGDQYERIGVLELDEDPLAGEVFHAGREAIEFLGAHLPAYELFIGLQQRGMACGIVYSPDEMIGDPHFVERGFPHEIEYETRKHELYPSWSAIPVLQNAVASDPRP